MTTELKTPDVTMTIEGIGTISNEVVAGAPLVPIPAARRA